MSKKNSPKVVTESDQDISGNTGSTGLSSEVEKQPESALLAMLYQQANADGLQLRDLAAEIGVTYGYIYQLMNGMRGVSEVSDEFITGCARYLKQSQADVLALAGK